MTQTEHGAKENEMKINMLREMERETKKIQENSLISN